MKNRNSQSATPSECNSIKMFINRPFAEGKTFPCGREHFWKSINSPRVVRLDHMRKNLIPHNEEEREALKLNQPTFNLTNRYMPEGGAVWNGRFLFCHNDTRFAQKVIDAHADELDIIFAFREPDYDRYYFLVEVHPDAYDNETAKKERLKVLNSLHRYFPRITPCGQWFFVRAVPEEYIDFIDEEALFGEDATTVCVPADPEPDAPDTTLNQRACKTMSIGEVMSQFFGNIFKSHKATANS